MLFSSRETRFEEIWGAGGTVVVHVSLGCW